MFGPYKRLESILGCPDYTLRTTDFLTKAMSAEMSRKYKFQDPKEVEIIEFSDLFQWGIIYKHNLPSILVIVLKLIFKERCA